VRAETIVEVGLDASGTSRLSRARCEPPLLVRESDDDGALLLLLVNGAAGPLGGDELSLIVIVGAGATVRVRSVAAALAQPGAHGGRSRSSTRFEIHDGAWLDWRPEPLVSVVGSDHEATTVVEAGSDVDVRITETVSLGRHGEPPGRLSLHQRALLAGRPVLDHRTDFAPGALLGAGGHGPGAAFRSTLHLGRHAPTDATSTVTAELVHAVLPLATGCALSVERALDVSRLRRISC